MFHGKSIGFKCSETYLSFQNAIHIIIFSNYWDTTKSTAILQTNPSCIAAKAFRFFPYAEYTS